MTLTLTSPWRLTWGKLNALAAQHCVHETCVFVVSWSRKAQQMVGHQPSSLLQTLISLLWIFTLRETPLYGPSPHSQLLPNFKCVLKQDCVFVLYIYSCCRGGQWFHRHAYLKATCGSCEGHASVSPILERNSRRKGKMWDKLRLFIWGYMASFFTGA